MVKRKKLRISILTLLIAVIVALSSAIIALNGHRTAAYASERDRFVELDGNSVFYTAIHGAEIDVTNREDESEGASHYTLFRIGSDETVSYRQNLAYKWISGDKDEEGNDLGTHSARHLSMELFFPAINFKSYYIKFETQQYTLTEDKKSTNYIVFTPNADKSAVQVSVSQSIEEDDDKNTPVNVGDPVAVNGRIEISIGNYDKGNYDVTVNDSTATGAFKNVYENFASYVASGDEAVTPLTFGAEFEQEGVETDNGAQMALVDISGQSFEMHKDGSVYKVKDTAAPALCFSQTPSYLEYGKSIGLQFRVIDVLANISSNSSRATAYYYVLTGDQVKNNDFVYDKIDYDAKTEGSTEGGEGENEGTETEKQTSPFIKVTTTSGDRIYSDENTFIPRKYLKSDVMGLVKIYYEISDYATSSLANTDRVFVDWYVEEALGAGADKALEDVFGYNTNKTGSKFLKLIKDKKGATYAPKETANYDEYVENVRQFRQEYQTKIDEAIADLTYEEGSGQTNGKLYAGGNKFYLPAIEWDFVDDYLTGTDYKYSIYYKGATTGSHTSLASNKLAIDLNDADVTYRFTIFITDAFGNPMRYPDKNGEWQEITTNDVWDEDFAELLPYFEFDVSYKEATAESPENLSISYVKTNYSGVSFDITGVSGTYTATYKLYVFDRNAYLEDTKDDSLDYDTFVANTQKLFDNEYKSGVNTRKYFTTVKPVSDLLESDENYDRFRALNWNATSITFTPQSVEEFYVIELQLTDNRSQVATPYFATVASSVQAASIKGESDWVENNMTSIILFVVAGVCLIALILLLVIKPKDKGDIDAIYSEVEAKDKKSGKKKNKKQVKELSDK